MTAPSMQKGEFFSAKHGILWMMAAMMMFSGTNAIAKLLMEQFPVIQIIWARYFFQFILLLIFLSPRLSNVFITENLRLQILRSLLLLGTSILFFFGLSYIALAEMSSIMFVAPILVTVLSMPLLGEKVRLRRWVSIIVGFFGALVIIRPGYGEMQISALFPIGAACLYALYQISTRYLRSENAMTTLLYTASSGTIILTAIVPFYWLEPDMKAWGMMIFLGVTSNLGHFSMIKAYRAAPAATVVPFSYVNLLWATLFGYILFSNLPDIWTTIGATIIAGSGLYIFHREHTLGKENTPSRVLS